MGALQLPSASPTSAHSPGQCNTYNPNDVKQYAVVRGNTAATGDPGRGSGVSQRVADTSVEGIAGQLNFVVQTMWLRTDTDIGNGYWIEFGVDRSVDGSVSPTSFHYGWYWARNTPTDGYSERFLGTSLAGQNLGGSGTWHTYQILWNGGLGSFDLRIDGVFSGERSYRNALSVGAVDIGLEVQHCDGNDGERIRKPRRSAEARRVGLVRRLGAIARTGQVAGTRPSDSATSYSLLQR